MYCVLSAPIIWLPLTLYGPFANSWYGRDEAACAGNTDLCIMKDASGIPAQRTMNRSNAVSFLALRERDIAISFTVKKTTASCLTKFAHTIAEYVYAPMLRSISNYFRDKFCSVNIYNWLIDCQ